MNYKLKQCFVWCSVALVVWANIILFGWMFKDLFQSLFFQEHQTMDQINDRFIAETSMEHEIVDFLQLFYHRRTRTSDIFLIDHGMLVKYLQEGDVSQLMESGHLPPNALTSRGKQQFAAFGIFKSDVKRIQGSLHYLLSIGWQMKVVTANGKYLHSLNSVEPLHMFFFKRSIVVQLAVFYPRNSYFWIGAFSNETAHQLRSEPWYTSSILYGHHSAIFDRFKLQYRFMVAMPEDVSHFIRQQVSSKFIECKHQHMYRFATLHQNALYDAREMETVSRDAVQIIQLMNQLSKWLRTEIWLFNGALLSWFRNCAPFRHMYNLDFALSYERVKHLNLTEELLEFAAHHSDDQLFVTSFMGLQKSGIEYRMQLIGGHQLKGISNVRLVPCYEEENETVSMRWAMFESEKEALQTVFFHPRSAVCSADYLGQKVLIPCEASETVLDEFGTDWFVPAEKWDSIFSPVNRINQSTVPIQSIEHFQAAHIKNSSSYLTYFFYLVVILAVLVGLVMRFKLWRQKKYI